MIIAINPGHYICKGEKYDPGAVNEEMSITEVNINVAVAEIAKEMLRELGHEVILIHEPELYDIVMKSDRADADIFISIHCNAAANKSAIGTETYYHASSIRGKQLAGYIQKELIGALGFLDRGIKNKQLYVTKHTDAVAVLIELGFISNNGEAAKLISNSYQRTAAEALVKGIVYYCNWKSICNKTKDGEAP